MLLGETADLSHKEMRQRWSAVDGHWAGRGLREIRVGIVASFNADSLVPYLGVQLVRRGFAPEFYLAPYSQIYQECMSPDSGIKRDRCDVSFILWRIEDLLSGQLDQGLDSPKAALEDTESEMARLLEAANRLRSDTERVVILSAPPIPRTRPLGVGDLTHAGGSWALHSKVLESLVEGVARLKGVFLLDVDAVQREVGTRSGDSAKMYMLARIPWTDAFFASLGRMAAITVEGALAPQKKCLVMDCDGTLWGGIVGEDGVNGIAIGEDAPGNAFEAFQKYVFTLRRQGVLLAICSKNNEDDVWEAFRERDMPLKEEHLAAASVNWNPKSVNLREIARELNIGLDSLVLIDDSPVEIAEVNANAPEVRTILLPDKEPERYIEVMETESPFPRFVLTQEDLRRAQMYQEERQREGLRSQMGSLEDFLEGLGIVVTIGRPLEKDLGRIAQLLNRTNQFNLTTYRRTESEVIKDWSDPSCRDYAVWVRDRFGDYGLTGYALLRGLPDAPVLDTFLMSCRVLGRGVETSLLARILFDLEGRRLRARFIPSSKNGVAQEFLPSHGFREVGDGEYEQGEDEVLVPAFVELLEPAPESVEMETPSGMRN